MGTNVVKAKLPPSRQYMLIAAVALSVIATYLIVRTFPQILYLRQAPASDDPILMAGGSLTVRAAAGGKFNKPAHDAVYTPANGTIVGADIYYRDAKGLPAIASLSLDPTDQVQFNYCASSGNCSTVTARSNPAGHGFVFGPLDGIAVSPDSDMFTLPGSVQTVAINGGTPYGCSDASGAGDKCSVVVRYCRKCK